MSTIIILIERLLFISEIKLKNCAICAISKIKVENKISLNREKKRTSFGVLLVFFSIILIKSKRYSITRGNAMLKVKNDLSMF
jgi:hypothetical protein